jgi:outer membrane protein TolC
LLPFSGLIHGQESFLQDPFNTVQQVSQNPAQKFFENETNDAACRDHTPEDQTWALLDVINQALCSNPQTRQAWANAHFQAGQLGIAEAAYLPTLTLNTTVSRSMNSSSSSLQVTNISSSGSGALPINRFTPIVTLNYLLYNFGSREAQLESSENALEASNWTHDAMLQTVMFAAIQAYYQVFATQSAAEASIITENASNVAWTAAQKRHEIGSAAMVDVLQAETGFAQAKLNRQKTEGDTRVATGALANVLGFQADHPLKLSANALPIPDDEHQTFVHQLIEDAKSMRPDLAAAEATMQVAEANVKAAEAGHLPSISLIANYGYNHTSIPSDT